MPDHHAQRRRRLAQLLSERDLGAALVTKLVNVRYLTGFTGSNAAVLVDLDGTATLATDGRYRDQSAAECPDLERRIDRALVPTLLEDLILPAGAALGLELHDLNVDAYVAVAELLAERNLTSQSLTRAVEDLRIAKDDGEIEALRAACAISTTALEQLYGHALAGRSEREIARDLEWRMFALGAEAIAFDTIVASGPHSAIPHHTPTDRVVEPGDLLKIDFGARYDGYHADCTRTATVGRAADWQREIYAAVRVSQQAGLDALVGGRPVAESDERARAALEAAGYLGYFTTGLGHGVGLQIHEDPFISAKHSGKLLPRTTLTMEPGIYLAGRGGVRIEDTLVVTDGSADVLTTATKDLLELA